MNIEPYCSLAEQRGLPVRTVIAAAQAGRLRDVVRLPPVKVRPVPIESRILREQVALATLTATPIDEKAELRALDERLRDPVVQRRMLELRFLDPSLRPALSR